MPILPDHRWRDPIDWRELSVFVRFTRAKGLREHRGRTAWRARARSARAGAPAAPLRLADLAGEAALPSTRVVLASAHLDHDPGNNRQCKLAACASAATWRTIAPSIAVAAGRRCSGFGRWGDLFLGVYR